MTTRPRPGARVFLVRRLLVLSLAVLLVWLVVTLISDDEPATQTEAPASVAQVSVEIPVENCKAEDLWLRPVVPAGQAGGNAFEIDLAISTTSEESCWAELRDSQIIAFVTENGSRVWSSDRCPTGFLKEPIAVSPGWVTTTSVVWRCNASRLSGGSYGLKLATYGGEPGIITFKLKDAPQPEPEPSPKSSEKPKD